MRGEPPAEPAADIPRNDLGGPARPVHLFFACRDWERYDTSMKVFLMLLPVCLLLAACTWLMVGATGRAKTPETVQADDQWKKLLTPEQYRVLREKGTERAFTGEYDQFFQPGTYVCAACGAELFSSDTKFDSGCGWPAFYAAKAGDRVKLIKDYSLGMVRTEVECAKCGGHLGHIFDDAPQTPTGERYCINSVSLKFIPAGTGGTK